MRHFPATFAGLPKRLIKEFKKQAGNRPFGKGDHLEVVGAACVNLWNKAASQGLPIRKNPESRSEATFASAVVAKLVDASALEADGATIRFQPVSPVDFPTNFESIL